MVVGVLSSVFNLQPRVCSACVINPTIGHPSKDATPAFKNATTLPGAPTYGEGHRSGPSAGWTKHQEASIAHAARVGLLLGDSWTRDLQLSMRLFRC